MPDAGKLSVSGIETREVVVQPLPHPDKLIINRADSPVCFILDDGTALCKLLAERLTAQDWNIVILQWPKDVLTITSEDLEGFQKVPLQGISEEKIQAALSEAARPYGPASAFVYLEPLWSHASNPDLAIRQESSLQGVFLLAKHLSPALNTNKRDGRSAFVTVTHMDGVLGTSGEGNWSALSGGLYGLVKTLNLEWETVFCRALDIHPAVSAEQAADHILNELEDPDQLLVEVGYSPQGRVTLALAEAVRSSS